ncbi:MAG: rRNA maturation RNase YbeY [Sandaracinus sp.]
MTVHLETRGRPRSKLSPRLVRTRATRMLAALELEGAELSLVLTDDPTIHALNRDYRKKDKPTDVLAFALREGPYAELAGAMLGDVVVSLDTAARQAREKKHSLEREVTMLVAHGLLHLLGYDHATRTEERRMTARTDALIAAAEKADRPRKQRAIARDRPKKP